MSDLGFLSPPLPAIRRKSTTVHLAPMTDTGWSWAAYREVSTTALCGVRGWCASTGPATCRRCLYIANKRNMDYGNPITDRIELGSHVSTIV